MSKTTFLLSIIRFLKTIVEAFNLSYTNLFAAPPNISPGAAAIISIRPMRDSLDLKKEPNLDFKLLKYLINLFRFFLALALLDKERAALFMSFIPCSESKSTSSPVTDL